MGFVHPAEWLAVERRLLGGRQDVAAPAQQQVDAGDRSTTCRSSTSSSPQGWSGQKYLDTQAALATGKIAMCYLSGARAIGYIEKYAPENMRDPEHFAPMLRPRGPSGKVGITTLDGENWAVFSAVEVPERGLRVPAALLQEGALPPYCHSVPIHLTPIFKSMLERSGLPGQRAHQEVEAVARRDADGAPRASACCRSASPGPRTTCCRSWPSSTAPSIVADMVVEVMVGRQEPEGGGRSGAEARRGAAHAARSQALVVSPVRAGRVRKSALVGWLLLAPSLLLLGGLVVFPVLYNVWLSLFDKHAFMPVQAFVGLGHYRYFAQRRRVLGELPLRRASTRARPWCSSSASGVPGRAAAERGLPRAQPPARRRAVPVHDPDHRGRHPVEVAAQRLLRPRQPPAHRARAWCGRRWPGSGPTTS